MPAQWTTTGQAGISDEVLTDARELLRDLRDIREQLRVDAQSARNRLNNGLINRRTYSDRMDRAQDQARTDTEAAWAKLSRSQVPVLAWFGTTFGGSGDDEDDLAYRGQAEIVLRSLTPNSTLDELDRLSREQGWCGEWGRFRNRAIDAQVATYDRPLFGGKPPEPEPEPTVIDPPANVFEAIERLTASLDRAMADYREAQRGHNRDSVLNRDRYYAATGAAWEAATAFGNPILAFVARNGKHYNETQVMLKYVLGHHSASLGDLDELARRQGWCGTWRQFRDLAIENGVVSYAGGTPIFGNKSPEVVEAVDELQAEPEPVQTVEPAADSPARPETVVGSDVLPDAQTFLDACTAAREVEAQTLRAIEDQGTRRYTENWYDARRGIRANAQRALNQAREQLGRSRHPVLRWLVTGLDSGFARHVEFLAPRLTAATTLQELDDFAKNEQGWCDTWDELRDQAIEAGVVSYARPLGPTPEPSTLAQADRTADDLKPGEVF